MLFWHVPAPNEALLISGSKRRAGDAQFRIVTGHGCWVLPVKQKASLLSLSLRETEISEDCVTQQGIRLAVRAVAVFKVGDDQPSIANAARRFLDEQASMEELVGRIFAGHLRSIVGGLTVEQIIRERDRVAQEVKDGSHSEMEKLGIVVDALQIQEIGDTSGYITNLAAPHAAAVASAARIAQARADQEATEREQQAAALKAEYERDTAIKRAGFRAETEQYNARAAQAGPLSQARASQEVIEEQTSLAERQAALAAQRLEAEVRRPADAEAYRLRTLAEAQRDQVRYEADARAYSERAVAQARADANNALASSLRDGNQELLAANRTVENLPALAEAAAEGISGSQLTVLNGTDGLNEIASAVVGQGLAILDALKKSPAAAGGTSAAAPPLADGAGSLPSKVTRLKQDGPASGP
ncbi:MULTISPECIES: SPFH domain-containing protein [Streptomyces]|uniref:SPFH domain-containing protein n=1 Tax=Streptomyces TaxID=1883 RepID=UPI000526B85C|nr:MULTISPECIES: flotillin family protein [Streptomyces]ARH89764.1 flotillin [Streptomyces sp. MOE7]MDC7340428.1 SPFH domain-containing protein [Streptomyces lydicus]UEG89892.1 flotillin [Streptomyces lydicus]